MSDPVSLLVLSTSLAVGALTTAQPSSVADQPSVLALDALPGPSGVAQLLLERSPDLVAARARAESARAEADRARRLPNPGLDLAWSTIPVGATNPPEVLHPLAEIPNYGATLSFLLELGKRGPRQRATANAATAAGFDLWELMRRQYIDLLQTIGRIASSQARIEVLSELAEDAGRLTELQRRRADHGDAAGLDVDRARLEEEKLRSSLAEERQKLSGLLVECSRSAGVSCSPFSSADRAHAFLEAHSAFTPGLSEELEASIDSRPDLKSLSAQEESARAALQLAHAHRLPDPTVRAGYVYDRFLISGNQGNSFNVGLSIPLPLFERGQADAAQAAAAMRAARTTRELLRAQGRRDLETLLDQARRMHERQRVMHEETIPMARGVVDRLTTAVRTGGASLQDLLLARRTLGELLEDSADLDLAALEVSLAIARIVSAPPLLEGGSS